MAVLHGHIMLRLTPGSVRTHLYHPLTHLPPQLNYVKPPCRWWSWNVTCASHDALSDSFCSDGSTVPRCAFFLCTMPTENDSGMQYLCCTGGSVEGKCVLWVSHDYRIYTCPFKQSLYGMKVVALAPAFTQEECAVRDVNLPTLPQPAWRWTLSLHSLCLQVTPVLLRAAASPVTVSAVPAIIYIGRHSPCFSTLPSCSF